MAGFSLTPVIRAHLDLLEVHDNLVRARGWIFRPDIAGESVDINKRSSLGYLSSVI
jgi:hypothetical protein